MSDAVIQADCMVYMANMSPKSVDLTLTDVPYGEVNRDSNGLRLLDKGAADSCGFDISEFSYEVARVTKGSAYIFCSTEQVSRIRSMFVSQGMTTRLCVWEKTNPSPMNGQHVWLSGVECCVFGKHPKATFNEKCKNTVWRHPVPRRRNHPTPKPLALFEYLIGVSSNPGDLVFDPCCGGGTTAVAAVRTRRKYLCLDKSDVCVRWTNEWVEEQRKAAA